MAYATLDELRASLGKPEKTPEKLAYDAKMMHAIPQADVVDRVVFILQQVAGKRVLEFGASGPMHDGIVKAAAECYGVDRVAAHGVVAFNLDEIRADFSLATGGAHDPVGPPLYFHVPNVGPFKPDVIICGEVLEHLSNPGWFLQRLKRQYSGVPVVITVPNAFSRAGRQHAERGYENVNGDHCAWYSWKTMSVLLSRYGYIVKEFHFYGGEPFTAEGLVFVCE